jgi:hypothetical protein
LSSRSIVDGYEIIANINHHHHIIIEHHQFASKRETKRQQKQQQQQGERERLREFVNTRLEYSYQTE